MVTVTGSATVGAESFTPTASITLPSGGYPAPVDLGNTLAAYIDAAAAGQVVVIPAGKALTSGTITGKSKSAWAFVLAETPGSVTVTDVCQLTGVVNVVFGGIKFLQGVWPYGHSVVGLWYCDVKGKSGRAALNGLYTSGTFADKVLLFGTDVHDSDTDTIKSNLSNFTFQGGRCWAAHDSTGVNHDDTIQIQQGTNQVVADAVFGLDKAGNPSDNGHIQVQADLGNVQVAFTNIWVTTSGNYAMTADDKGSHPLVMTVTGARVWNNNFGNGSTVVNKAGQSVSGTSITTSGSIFTAPTGANTPPDVAWQAAHPYGTAVSWFVDK